METFVIFIGDGSRVFRKKNPNENAENEVSKTCYAPMYDEISSCTISL
jgi:hypothetical protein